MTSKEINDMIIDLENQIERFGGMSQFNYQLDILKSYKQDLDRLEVLELSNKTLDQICETQHEENEKLIKVLDILKDKVRITVKIPYVWIETKDNCLYFKVNQQEYELLKEVLG